MGVEQSLVGRDAVRLAAAVEQELVAVHVAAAVARFAKKWNCDQVSTKAHLVVVEPVRVGCARSVAVRLGAAIDQPAAQFASKWH